MRSFTYEQFTGLAEPKLVAQECNFMDEARVKVQTFVESVLGFSDLAGKKARGRNKSAVTLLADEMFMDGNDMLQAISMNKVSLDDVNAWLNKMENMLSPEVFFKDLVGYYKNGKKRFAAYLHDGYHALLDSFGRVSEALRPLSASFDVPNLIGGFRAQMAGLFHGSQEAPILMAAANKESEEEEIPGADSSDDDTSEVEICNDDEEETPPGEKSTDENSTAIKVIVTEELTPLIKGPKKKGFWKWAAAAVAVVGGFFAADFVQDWNQPAPEMPDIQFSMPGGNGGSVTTSTKMASDNEVSVGESIISSEAVTVTPEVLTTETSSDINWVNAAGTASSAAALSLAKDWSKVSYDFNSDLSDWNFKSKQVSGDEVSNGLFAFLAEHNDQFRGFMDNAGNRGVKALYATAVKQFPNVNVLNSGDLVQMEDGLVTVTDANGELQGSFQIPSSYSSGLSTE